MSDMVCIGTEPRNAERLRRRRRGGFGMPEARRSVPRLQHCEIEIESGREERSENGG